MPVKPIAIYLPQFHPVKENDEWWGKGFTEWTNVTKAKPWFKGHYQPHLPADLGFYDLRLPEAREEQAKLAKEYGIYGFCYYHYWFNGRRILERPFREVFESGKPDFPFMLCWANENWTRIWDGGDKEVLLEQNYSESDDRAHIQSLIPYFKDERYIKIDGKPVFAVYKSALLPDVKRTIEVWREEAAKYNIELFICRFNGFGKVGEEYLKDGFDAAVDFQPFGHFSDEYAVEKSKRYQQNYPLRIKNKLRAWYHKTFNKAYYPKLVSEINMSDYNDYADFMLTKKYPVYNCFPGITPSWDNSSRRKGNAKIFHNANPKAYGKWLKHLIHQLNERNDLPENFIFINAWNEWAEGNHLEPCRKWGRGYLEETKRAVESSNQEKTKI